MCIDYWGQLGYDFFEEQILDAPSLYTVQFAISHRTGSTYLRPFTNPYLKFIINPSIFSNMSFPELCRLNI